MCRTSIKIDLLTFIFNFQLPSLFDYTRVIHLYHKFHNKLKNTYQSYIS